MSGQLTLKIDSMDNDAFAEDPRHETARILREIAARIVNGKESGVIHDVNGNKVGSWDMDLPEVEEEIDSQDD